MDNTNPTRDELEAMSDDQLRQLASQRGITVTSKADGGVPDTDDYLDALDPGNSDGTEPLPDEPHVIEGDKRARSAQAAAQRPKSRIDETIPGGRYIGPGGKLVNAHGQEIDDDGKVVDGTITPTPPVAQ